MIFTVQAVWKNAQYFSFTKKIEALRARDLDLLSEVDVPRHSYIKTIPSKQFRTFTFTHTAKVTKREIQNGKIE